MMTKEELIDMARQAGFVDYELDDGTTNAFDKRYEALAKMVAAKEREACAKFFDDNDTLMFWGSQAAREIRARGKNDY